MSIEQVTKTSSELALMEEHQLEPSKAQSREWHGMVGGQNCPRLVDNVTRRYQVPPGHPRPIGMAIVTSSPTPPRAQVCTAIRHVSPTVSWLAVIC